MSDTEKTLREIHDIPENISIVEAYKKSIGDDSSLNAQWKDKPHRHVYDLCNVIKELKEKFVKLEIAVRWWGCEDE